MKFFIKYILILFQLVLSQHSNAKLALAPVVISFKSQNQFVESVVKILRSEFGIPAPLIELRGQPNGCQKIPRAILQICILQNKELKLINWNKEKWEEDYGEFANFFPRNTELKNLPLTTSHSETTKDQPGERKKK